MSTENPIAHACRLLREAADEIQQGHTLSSNRADWTGEPEAKAAFDEHHAAADALEALAASLGAGGASPWTGAAGDAGWVMVPVDPTPEMCAVASIDEGARITDGPAFAADLYSAMLAASPPPPSSAKGVAL